MEGYCRKQWHTWERGLEGGMWLTLNKYTAQGIVLLKVIFWDHFIFAKCASPPYVM